MTHGNREVTGRTRVGGLMAALAFALGGVSLPPHASAAQQVIDKAPHIACEMEMLCAQKSFRKAQQATEEVLEALRLTVTDLEQGKNPEGLTYGYAQAQVDSSRVIERGFDNRLLEIQQRGELVSPDLKELRKKVALVRFKMNHIANTLLLMQDGAHRFEGSADIEGLRNLADAGDRIALSRLH